MAHITWQKYSVMWLRLTVCFRLYKIPSVPQQFECAPCVYI